jgi:hypothetical protein
LIFIRQGFAGALDANRREENEYPTRKLEITLPEPTQPHILLQCYTLYTKQKKKKGLMFFVVYLRLLRMIAAASTAMMTTAAAMAMYVVVGIALVGCGAMLGEGEVGAWVGADVGAAVWAGVVGAVVVAGAAEGAAVTMNAVLAVLL